MLATPTAVAKADIVPQIIITLDMDGKKIDGIGNTIPVAPYAFPGSPENNAILTDALCRSDVVIMAGNGVLSVGRDIKSLIADELKKLLKNQ